MASITAGRPGTLLHTWCNLETDFVQVIATSENEQRQVMGALLQKFGPNLSANAKADGPSSAALIPCPANLRSSVSLTVERHGGLVQPPIVSADGWDEFRVILFRDDAATELLAAVSAFGEYELVSKKPLRHSHAHGFFLPSTELMNGLTRRQADAVVAVADHGYYEEPRETTLAQVAQKVGLGRASLEEHVRKAENKILTALVPYLSIRAATLGTAKPRGSPFAGNNRHQRQEAPVPRPTRAQRFPNP